MWEDTLSFQNQQYTEKSDLLQKQNRNNSFDITITKKEQNTRISEFNIEYTQINFKYSIILPFVYSI